MNSHYTKEAKAWRVKILTATWFSYVGYYFCRKAYGIIKPELKTEFYFDSLELAQIWTAFLVSYMLGQFLSSALGRKLTCRLLLVTGMFISLVANFAFGSALHSDFQHMTSFADSSLLLQWGLGISEGQNTFYLLLFLMVVNGMAQATGWPGNVGLLAKWTTREERGRFMAWWGTCYQIGSIVAKHFSAFLLGWLGLSWSFWGTSLVMLGCWILFVWWGKDKPEDVGLEAFVEEIPASPSSSETTAPTTTSSARPWKEVVNLVVFMGTIYFCFKFLRYALDSWSTTLMKETFMNGARALTTTTAGHLSTAFDWVGFLGVILAGYLSDKTFKSERAPVIFWMSCGMTFFTFCLWAFGAHSLFVFVLCLALIGLMLMGPDSLLSGTAAMDISTREMAVVASGIINGLGSIGPVVQELVIGYMKKYYGNSSIFLLLLFTAAVSVLGSGLLWYWSRSKKLYL